MDDVTAEILELEARRFRAVVAGHPCGDRNSALRVEGWGRSG